MLENKRLQDVAECVVVAVVAGRRFLQDEEERSLGSLSTSLCAVAWSLICWYHRLERSAKLAQLVGLDIEGNAIGEDDARVRCRDPWESFC